MIAKRGEALPSGNQQPAAPKPAASNGPVKTLSLSAADTGAAKPKVEKTGGTKVLSLGGTSTPPPAAQEKEKEKPKGKADEKEKTEKDSSKTSTDDKGL